MEAEISFKCQVITDYSEAQKAKKKGHTVWTLFDGVAEQKLKKDGDGYVIIPDTKQIVLFRREKWEVK